MRWWTKEKSKSLGPKEIDGWILSCHGILYVVQCNFKKTNVFVACMPYHRFTQMQNDIHSHSCTMQLHDYILVINHLYYRLFKVDKNDYLNSWFLILVCGKTARLTSNEWNDNDDDCATTASSYIRWCMHAQKITFLLRFHRQHVTRYECQIKLQYLPHLTDWHGLSKVIFFSPLSQLFDLGRSKNVHSSVEHFESKGRCPWIQRTTSKSLMAWFYCDQILLM